MDTYNKAYQFRIYPNEEQRVFLVAFKKENAFLKELKKSLTLSERSYATINNLKPWDTWA